MADNIRNYIKAPVSYRSNYEVHNKANNILLLDINITIYEIHTDKSNVVNNHYGDMCNWCFDILYYLYTNNVLTLDECFKLKAMILSPDKENNVLAYTIIGNKYDDFYFSQGINV